MEKTLDTLYRIVKEPKLWILISVAFFLIYFLASKFKLPEHINIIGILKEYKAIFRKKKDFALIVGLPLTIAMATNLEKPIDESIANTLCVVISILAAAVVSFMAMTSDRADNILGKEKTNRNSSDKRVIYRNLENPTIGMFEMLLSVIMLVLIFLQPITVEDGKISWLVGLAIYDMFYWFIFNLFIMMRRLHQIYRGTLSK